MDHHYRFYSNSGTNSRKVSMNMELRPSSLSCRRKLGTSWEEVKERSTKVQIWFRTNKKRFKERLSARRRGIKEVRFWFHMEEHGTPLESLSTSAKKKSLKRLKSRELSGKILHQNLERRTEREEKLLTEPKIGNHGVKKTSVSGEATSKKRTRQMEEQPLFPWIIQKL